MPHDTTPRTAPSAAQVLVDSLHALGVRRTFGVPGESYLAVLDALHDAEVAFTLCRHEGGAAFMAAAWGKLTGQPGICFVTRGPGATNAAIGVHTARQDSSPMILFVGQVATDMIGREAFQEVDYRATFGPLAKWAVEIDRPERLPEILARAWRTALSGRPGPVVVALPEDMLRAPCTTPALRHVALAAESAPDPQAVADIRAALAGARRPVILMGGATWQPESQRALETFAEASHIPLVSVFRYQDQIDNFSGCYCGEAGVGMWPSVKALIREADVLLALNARFGENSTDGYTLLEVPVPAQRLLHVHVSEAELGKVYLPEIAVAAGPNAFVRALTDAGPVGNEARAGYAREARATWEAGLDLPPLPSPVDMGAVTRHLQEVLPEDVILTNGAGNFAAWPNKFFRFGPKARLLAPQAGAMGYGIPAAVAAALAHPDRTVVCFAGDGDFQMTQAELASAVQAGARLIVLVVNNGTYGTIRAHQERHFPGRVSGTTLVNPDFVGLARAYGLHGERVTATDAFAEAFARARAAPKGAVLDLEVAAEALTPRQSLSAIRAAALKGG